MAGTKRQRREAKQRKQKRRKFLFEVIDSDSNDNTHKTDIVSINDNCIEEILEWLSLSDLVSLSTTCRRMKDVVSKYFSRKYPTKRMTVKMDSDSRGRIEYWPRELYVQRFHEYFQNIAIRGTSLLNNNYF